MFLRKSIYFISKGTNIYDISIDNSVIETINSYKIQPDEYIWILKQNCVQEKGSRVVLCANLQQINNFSEWNYNKVSTNNSHFMASGLGICSLESDPNTNFNIFNEYNKINKYRLINEVYGHSRMFVSYLQNEIIDSKLKHKIKTLSQIKTNEYNYLSPKWFNWVPDGIVKAIKYPKEEKIFYIQIIKSLVDTHKLYPVFGSENVHGTKVCAYNVQKLWGPVKIIYLPQICSTYELIYWKALISGVFSIKEAKKLKSDNFDKVYSDESVFNIERILERKYNIGLNRALNANIERTFENVNLDVPALGFGRFSNLDRQLFKAMFKTKMGYEKWKMDKFYDYEAKLKEKIDQKFIEKFGRITDMSYTTIAEVSTETNITTLAHTHTALYNYYIAGTNPIFIHKYFYLEFLFETLRNYVVITPIISLRSGKANKSLYTYVDEYVGELENDKKYLMYQGILKTEADNYMSAKDSNKAIRDRKRKINSVLTFV